MASPDLDAAKRALADHHAFTSTSRDYDVTTTPFPASVTPADSHTEITYLVTVTVPTLNAAVADEEVATVVQTGWYETFERRLEDIHGVTRSDIETASLSLDDAAAQIEITVRFSTRQPAQGAEDAKAIVDYIEGTYLEGVIPGYTYTEPVSDLLDRAKNRSAGHVDDQH